MAQRTITKSHGVDAAPADRLTPQQATAVDVLAGGAPLTDVAVAVGVDRATVSQWVNHHTSFQAQLHARRQELWGEIVEGLRGLLPKALAVLQEELEGEGPGRLQAATTLFKLVGIYGQIGPPTGPTTVEGVEQAHIRQAVQRAQATLTPEDVRRAEERRESDRSLSALMSLNLGPLQ